MPRAARNLISPTSDAMRGFRKECREFAEHWLDVQRDEFKRLGVVGDWDNPYTPPWPIAPRAGSPVNS